MPGNGIDVAPAIDVLTLLGDAPAGQAAIKTYEPAGQSEKAAATR